MNHPTKGPIGPDGGKGRGRNQDRCLTEVDLENYLYDRLRSEDLERVEEHLLICTSCQDRLAGEEEYVTAFRTAATELAGRKTELTGQKPAGKHGWSLGELFGNWGGWMKPAAAAVALAALVLVVRVPFQNQNNPSGSQNVNLSTERGDGNLATASAGLQLTLNMDLSQLEQHPSYRVQVVTADKGSLVMEEIVKPVNGRPLLQPLTQPLNPGDYVIRIYSGGAQQSKDSALLQEYMLRVTQRR